MNRIVLTYLGQTGFIIDYGNTRLVTDPYLSDYLDQKFYSARTPWRRLYPPPVTLEDLNPQAILISHAHGDHLDPWTLTPYYRGGGRALLVLPAPERDGVSRLGAPHVHGAVAEERLTIGRVTVTPVPCAHTALHADGPGRYHELSYLLECGRMRVFFGGDLSLYDGLTERLAQAECDALLLPVNGGDYYRTAAGIIGNMDCVEAAKLTARCGAGCFIPMHHDLYAINGCRQTWIQDAADDAGVQVRFMKPGASLTLEARQN